MNRYMITREKIKGQEYLISALYDEKKHMIEVLPEAAGETSLLGNIYVGKVENIVTNLNAAFVKIAPDIRCYLPLSDVKNPVFTRKLSQTKALAAGDELLVQVSREALKTKDPAVTTNLTIANYVMLLMILIMFIQLFQMKKGKPVTKWLMTLALAFSGIALFSYERGNVIYLAVIGMVCFIEHYQSENKVLREWAFIALAFAAAIKGYLRTAVLLWPVCPDRNRI